MADGPVFKARTGIGAAKKAEEEARPAFTSDRVKFLELKSDGDQAVLRFIDDGDDWVFAKQHNFVPTREKPEDWKSDRKWPEQMNATCRFDEAFGGYYADCYIDTMHNPGNKSGKYTAPIRVWARAIVRDEVLGTPDMVIPDAETKREARNAGGILQREVGKPVGYTNATVEVDVLDAEGKATGKKITVPKVIVVNQPRSTFFAGLQGYFNAHGTVLDRDYLITRDGVGKDTNYLITDAGETPDWDLSEPKHMRALLEEIGENRLPNLHKMVADRATDDFYGFWFDPSYERKSRKKDGEEGSESTSTSAAKAAPKAAPAEEESKGSGEVDQSKLDALSQRVRGRNPRRVQEEPVADEEPAEEAPAATPVGKVSLSA